MSDSFSIKVESLECSSAYTQILEKGSEKNCCIQIVTIIDCQIFQMQIWLGNILIDDKPHAILYLLEGGIFCLGRVRNSVHHDLVLS